MWIDTHCHLDAAEFDADRDTVTQAARAAGVSRIVIPSVGRDNFTTVRELAQRTPGAVYALGIHPMYTPHAGSAGHDWKTLPDTGRPRSKHYCVSSVSLLTERP